MGTKVLKIAKILVPVLGLGVSVATKYLESKELDEKIASKVAEALANK